MQKIILFLLAVMIFIQTQTFSVDAALTVMPTIKLETAYYNHSKAYSGIKTRLKGTIPPKTCDDKIDAPRVFRMISQAHDADPYRPVHSPKFIVDPNNPNIFTVEFEFSSDNSKDVYSRHVKVICGVGETHLAEGDMVIDFYNYTNYAPRVKDARVISESGNSMTLGWTVINSDFDLRDYEILFSKADYNLTGATSFEATSSTHTFTDIPCGVEQSYIVFLHRKGYFIHHFWSNTVYYTKACPAKSIFRPPSPNRR